jgi:hypothetical protein
MIDNILKFELALERHHKKLKSRLNKFNFSSEKKYELDGEDCLESFNFKGILPVQERNLNDNNLNEIINIKTDYFTNNSNINIREFDSNEDRISDGYNNYLFIDKENKYNKNKKNYFSDFTDSKSPNKEINENNILKKIDISTISRHPKEFSINVYNYDINNKNKTKKNYQNRNNIQPGSAKVFLMRNDSFSLPRTNSKKYSITNFK